TGRAISKLTSWQGELRLLGLFAAGTYSALCIEESETVSGQKPHVLLVEENDILAEVTSFRLELLGYRVTTVRSGQQALAKAHSERVDGMIIDLTLSDMGGLELIEALGRDEQTTKIPIMALSFDAELDTVQQAFRAGASDYLVAPYNPLVLESKVEQLVATPASS